MSPIADARRLVAHPLLHFLLLGGLLFVVDTWREAGGEAAPEAREPLVVEASDVELLAREYRRLHGVAPDGTALRVLVESWIDEELTVHEARRRGWLRDDLLIRRRLSEKVSLLGGPADPVESDSVERDPVDRALALGLDRHDPIVRGRLVQRLHREWVREAGAVRASPDVLRRQLEENPERYRRPVAARVSHVFTTGGEEAANRLLGALRREGVQGANAHERGDAFLGGHHLPLRNAARLATSLGEPAAELASSAPTGEWVGPVESAWGHHLLWVHERRPGELPDVAAIRDRLEADLFASHEAAAIEEAVRALRASWPIRFADGVEVAIQGESS